MADISPIQKPFAPDDMPGTLRSIADGIEAGKWGLMTTCVVVLGHTSSRIAESGDKIHTDVSESFGCGPRCDPFTVRGLLLTVAMDMGEGKPL